MRDHVSEIRRLGGDLAAIGTGDRAYAAAFAEAEGIDFPLLVDPELASYRAAGARRAGGATFLRPRQALRAGAVSLRGHRQRTAGLHPLQLGATHVITPGGDVAFAWINDDFGDHAPVADVIAAVAGRPAT